MKNLLLAILTIGFINNTQAQVLLNENFSYGNIADTLTNPVIGGSLWKRHSGTGGPIPYTTTSLSYTGYASSGTIGCAKLINATSSREDANIAINSTTSGNVYVSFLVNVTSGGGATGDYFFHINDSQGLSIGISFRGKLWIKDGSTAGTFKLGLTKGASVTSAVFSQDYNLNTTYLVVLKYVFNAATTTDDSTYAWIFSSGVPASEPAAQLTATDITQTDLSKVRSICLRQGSVGNDTLRIDGIRVSSSWSSTALPVQFKSFTTTKGDNAVNLKWSTASESSNKGFEIQRSVNGAKYQTVGFVKGTGNSNIIKTYSFTDAHGLTGNICYRLKQIDFDGASAYSKVTCVNIEAVKTTEVITTPNPFNTSLHIKYNSLNDGSANMQIIDMLGKTHQNTNMSVNKGENMLTLDTDALPLGIYFIRITNGTEVTTQRIVKR